MFTELTSLCYSQNADETIINFYKITFNDLTGSKNYSFKSYATGKIIEGKHDPLPLLNAIDLLTYEVTVTEHNIQPTWVVCMQFRLNALKKISMLENYDKLVVQIDGIYYAEITAKALKETLKEIIKDKLELNVALGNR